MIDYVKIYYIKKQGVRGWDKMTFWYGTGGRLQLEKVRKSLISNLGREQYVYSRGSEKLL